MTVERPASSRFRLAPALGIMAAALAAVLATAVAFSGCSSSNPAGPSSSETFLVDPAGTGDFVTIQEALNAASEGDTVLVAPGTYAGAGNKNLNFGGASVVLSGTGERDEVVIDCEGEGRGFYIDGASPVIENLAVTNGDTASGGGMYMRNASPMIRNVRFIGNAASVDGGGGIYCHNSSPSLEDVLFDLNIAEIQGGGMLCVRSSPSLTNVVFYHNRAEWSGGGMACFFSSPAFTECIFRESYAVYGGAIYCGSSSPSVASCTFVDNTGSEGSGITCVDESAPAITRTIFAFNGPGEALYCQNDLYGPFTTLSCLYSNGELNELCGTYTTSMLYVDPLFCDRESGDLTLRAVSLCLPSNNSWNAQMGALGEGCE